MAERRRRERAMGVRQLTLTGELVATYMSHKAAAIATHISRNSISLAANGLKREAGGFRWATFELPRERRRYVRDETLRREAEGYIAYVNRRKVAAERDCLMCGRRFISKDHGNRRCSRCERIVDGYNPAGPYTAHAWEPYWDSHGKRMSSITDN